MLCEADTATPRGGLVVDAWEHAHVTGPVRDTAPKRLVGLTGPSDEARHDVALAVAERTAVFLHRFADGPRRLVAELLGGEGALVAAGAGPVPGAGTYRFLRTLEDRLPRLAGRLTAMLSVERSADVAVALVGLHDALERAGEGLTVPVLCHLLGATGLDLDTTLWTRLALARAARAARTVVLVDAVHPAQVAAIKATPRGLCAFVEPPGFDGSSPLLGECAVRVAVTPDDPRATDAAVQALVEVIR